MEVSVIIPTRDHYVTLARCLKSLKEALERTPIKAEVLVLDGGRESSADVLEDAKIENSSIAAVEPWWAYSKIINEGVKLTKGEIILHFTMTVACLKTYSLKPPLYPRKRSLAA